jgi:UDP-3-O-[3-hydroxymyristoyl] N-acetylglucosamine deacetylase
MEPSLVLLDIWLPGIDGMQLLKRLHDRFPVLPIIMMSGHAGIEAAVAAIKAGAYDFLEKPLHLEVLLDKVASALKHRPSESNATLPSDTRLEIASADLSIPPGVVEVVDSPEPQRTLRGNVVLNGIGLLSGRNTGIILSPLGINEGIVYQTLDGQTIRGHITSLEDFSQPGSSKTFSANSTTLDNGRRRVRTIEHLMAVLSMYGITNVLIKVDEEIPNVDGSAKDFCDLIEEAGIEEQTAATKVAVIRKKIGVGNEDKHTKHVYAEPFEGFEISMRVDYAAPIGEQILTFNPESASFAKDIAPARSFNTFENIEMAQKLGKVGGGYLHSHIIMYDGKVINTELRYPDEFVRHKILDIIGDLYLLGMKIRGRIVANMTSHGYNQALVQRLYQAVQSSSRGQDPLSSERTR